MSSRTSTICVVGLIGLQAGVLFFMGQPPICTCGYVKLWEGVVLSSGNSQHIFDWYTFSHIIHGFIFYFVLALLFPRMSFSQRIVFAVAIEAGWEIFENTPWLIDHYRQQALAQGYIGDSIINSLMDTCAMILGFIFAARFPTWLTISLALSLELFTGYFIRDGLTLNIINLIHPFDLISHWQSGS